MDFTIKTYKKLLQTLLDKNYHIFSFNHFILLNSSTSPLLNSKTLILRHDVDRKPQNALRMAHLEAEMGIKASYYFRIPKTFKPEIIKQIAELGHEIGYHYENLSEISKKSEAGRKKALFEKALKDFEKNLNKLMEFYPVKTICMHGSPLSKWDNRDLWKKYDYHNYGIIGEPYFDVDFDEVFYLTDTGRCWNSYKFSLRDKMPQQERWSKEGLVFKTTHDIIKAVQQNRLPNKIMLTIHPQRWTNNLSEWTIELLTQKTKNMIKRVMIKINLTQIR